MPPKGCSDSGWALRWGKILVVKTFAPSTKGAALSDYCWANQESMLLLWYTFWGPILIYIMGLSFLFSSLISSVIAFNAFSSSRMRSLSCAVVFSILVSVFLAELWLTFDSALSLLTTFAYLSFYSRSTSSVSNNSICSLVCTSRNYMDLKFFCLIFFKFLSLMYSFITF